MMRTFLWLSGLMLTLPALSAENNLKITGNLVTEPCTLDLNSSEISLDFGNLVSKYFYTADRTPAMPFSVVLTGCDTSLGDSATVTFQGTESQELNGFLVPDDGDTHGIAFGIETDDSAATPVLFNEPSPAFTLTDGENRLNLRGFVQAEPKAIAARSIKPGAFTGTATFEIEYP